MRLTIIPIITLLFLATISTVNAGDSSVNVNINNRVNAQNNTSTSTSETTTKVDIEQEGGGTSSVKVNGKEWKVEGPGEIHVDESTNSDPNQTPTISPTPSENPTPTPTVLSDADEEKPSFFEIIKLSFRNFFLRLFGRI